MEISSVSSQAMALKENLSVVQLGIAAIKQAATAQDRMTEMLAKRAKAVPPSDKSEFGTLDTFA